MRTASKFVLKSFVGPFIMTFFIALFVLLMQFVWLWIDELIGKGLEWYVIVELVTYVSASLVPMALPLAILLSSLMTFGNLGERYELVAFKSAGVSLQRVMRPLIITMVLVSFAAFLFSNYALPIANLKMRSLLYDISHQKPTINVKPRIFYDEIEGYSLRVEGKKETKEGQRLEKIMIYDHTDRRGNRSVTIADHGLMYTTADNKYLILEMFDGHTYEDQKNPQNHRTKYPFIRSSFDKNIIRFDLSAFQLKRSKEDLFKDNYQMLNMSQLSDAVDTLQAEQEKYMERYKTRLKSKYTYFLQDTARKEKIKQQPESDAIDSAFQTEAVVKPDKPHIAAIEDTNVTYASFMESLEKESNKRVISHAINEARSHRARSNSSALHKKHKKEFIHNHYIEWHRKLTLSIACLILFFIGAPLGAIIRKGGLGMPVVISVIFFIIYYILSISGEKMSKEGVVDPVWGMWLASIILFPLGVYITYKATTDSPVLQWESYTKLFSKIFKRKND